MVVVVVVVVDDGGPPPVNLVLIPSSKLSLQPFNFTLITPSELVYLRLLCLGAPETVNGSPLWLEIVNITCRHTKMGTKAGLWNWGN